MKWYNCDPRVLNLRLNLYNLYSAMQTRYTPEEVELVLAPLSKELNGSEGIPPNVIKSLEDLFSVHRDSIASGDREVTTDFVKAAACELKRAKEGR